MQVILYIIRIVCFVFESVPKNGRARLRRENSRNCPEIAGKKRKLSPLSSSSLSLCNYRNICIEMNAFSNLSMWFITASIRIQLKGFASTWVTIYRNLPLHISTGENKARFLNANALWTFELMFQVQKKVHNPFSTEWNVAKSPLKEHVLLNCVHCLRRLWCFGHFFHPTIEFLYALHKMTGDVLHKLNTQNTPICKTTGEFSLSVRVTSHLQKSHANPRFRELGENIDD